MKPLEFYLVAALLKGIVNLMVFIELCIGAILGSVLTLFVVLYWQSLVDHVILPPEKQHEPAKLIDLDIRDAENPKVWLGCLLQFLFAELKDTEKLQKWFREKLIIEVEELKEKLPSRIVKDIKLNKFGLGTQPPIISNVKLADWKTNQTKDIIEEVAVRFDLRYAGEFFVSLNVVLPVGQDAFVFIRLRQLVGNLELRFSRQPFTHWSIAFTEEPQMVLDAVTRVNNKAIPQLANIIVTKLKRNTRRRHVLPNFKIRFPPFFPRPMGQPAPTLPTVSSSSNLPDLASKNKTPDMQQLLPNSINVHLAAYSRLPVSNEPGALLFFTMTLDSAPLYKQFSHVESFTVQITDPNEAIGLAFIPSLFPVDAIDLQSKKFSILQGYLISAIVADSPAQRAGIRPGGVLISVEGQNLASSNNSVDNILRKAALTCKNGLLKLEICNAESPQCQLIPFYDAMMSPVLPGKDALSESNGSLDNTGNDNSAMSSFEVPDLAAIKQPSNLRFRHRKNLSNVSAVNPSEIAKATGQAQKLRNEELNSQPISRSSSDTNLSIQHESQSSVGKPVDGNGRPTSLFSPMATTKPLPSAPKDLNFLAERPLQQAANLPPSGEDCVVLRYNDTGPIEEQDQDQQDILVGDVLWTRFRAYPTTQGLSTTVNETLTFHLFDEKSSSSFLNIVAWIGVPESLAPQDHVSLEKGLPAKWSKLHAVSYATFDLSTIVEELNITGKSSNGYVRRTSNLHPFANVATPSVNNDGSPTEGTKNTLPLANMRGFAPELCFGDVSLGFTWASGSKHIPIERIPFIIYRHVEGGASRQQHGNQIGSNATLKGMSDKLKTMRENCEHQLMSAVSSRSQPCTVCGKSLGILQRWSRAHAPFTCLKCGLLCHPRCVPTKTGKLAPSSQSKPPSPTVSAKLPPSELDVSTGGNITHSDSSLAVSSESLPGTPSQSSGMMSKLTSRAKKIVAVAREKEQKIVAKAAPKLTQKWRDLRNRSAKNSTLPGSNSSTSLPLEYGSFEGDIEIGEDVDLLLGGVNENQLETVVAEDLIRAWAAKAEESPSAALEGTLAEALLSNGESDALLFQLKNLGRELFADLDVEERRTRLDSVISRLTDQLDEESERHAELKTQWKVVRSEEAISGSGNSGLIKKVKQNESAGSASNSAASFEAQLSRCDQRIRSLCLLIVHYSAGLDDCISTASRKDTLRSTRITSRASQQLSDEQFADLPTEIRTADANDISFLTHSG